MLKNIKPAYFVIGNVIIQALLAIAIYIFSPLDNKINDLLLIALIIILTSIIYFFLFVVSGLKETSTFTRHYGYAMAATLIFWVGFIAIFKISEPLREAYKENRREQKRVVNHAAHQKKLNNLVLKLSKRFPDYRFYKTDDEYSSIYYITPGGDSVVADGLLMDAISVRNTQKMTPVANTTLLWQKGMEMGRIFLTDIMAVEIYKKIADKKIMTYEGGTPGEITAELVPGARMRPMNRKGYMDIYISIDRPLLSPLIMNTMRR